MNGSSQKGHTRANVPTSVKRVSVTVREIA